MMYNFKDYWKKSTVRFRRHAQIKKGSLDIAPLIDVVFLLLIFFMLTSSFVSQPGIKVKLPKAITGELLHRNVVVITITKDSKIYLDDKETTLEKLRGKLRQVAKDNKALLIKSDTKAPLGQMVEVWDLCRELGISQVNIATTTKK